MERRTRPRASPEPSPPPWPWPAPPWPSTWASSAARAIPSVSSSRPPTSSPSTDGPLEPTGETPGTDHRQDVPVAVPPMAAARARPAPSGRTAPLRTRPPTTAPTGRRRQGRTSGFDDDGERRRQHPDDGGRATPEDPADDDSADPAEDGYPPVRPPRRATGTADDDGGPAVDSRIAASGHRRLCSRLGMVLGHGAWAADDHRGEAADSGRPSRRPPPARRTPATVLSARQPRPRRSSSIQRRYVPAAASRAVIGLGLSLELGSLVLASAPTPAPAPAPAPAPPPPTSSGGS